MSNDEERIIKNILAIRPENYDRISHYKYLEEFSINQAIELMKIKERIDKAIEILNNPWSFESGNKKVDEITHQKKRDILEILKGEKE